MLVEHTAAVRVLPEQPVPGGHQPEQPTGHVGVAGSVLCPAAEDDVVQIGEGIHARAVQEDSGALPADVQRVPAARLLGVHNVLAGRPPRGLEHREEQAVRGVDGEQRTGRLGGGG